MLKAATLFSIGALLLIGATFNAVGVIRFVRSAVAADGRVSKLNAGGSHPQIEFTTGEGERVSYPQGGLIFGFKPNDRVTVLYDVTNPRRTATVDRFGALWFWSLMLASLGLAAIWGGWSTFSDTKEARANVV